MIPAPTEAPCQPESTLFPFPNHRFYKSRARLQCAVVYSRRKKKNLQSSPEIPRQALNPFPSPGLLSMAHESLSASLNTREFWLDLSQGLSPNFQPTSLLRTPSPSIPPSATSVPTLPCYSGAIVVTGIVLEARDSCLHPTLWLTSCVALDIHLSHSEHQLFHS